MYIELFGAQSTSFLRGAVYHGAHKWRYFHQPLTILVMNEKEMNLAILAELKRIAKEVFAKVEISKEGTYTAAELWNEKNSFGENIWVNYKGTENDIYTAEIDTFKMHVTPQKLWYVLWKFERLCNVKQADKIRFIYGQQEGENISEKAMYLDKEGKAILRKKNLIKLSDNVAIEPNKKTKRYNMYYFVVGMWYLLCQGFDESQYKAIKERIEKDDNYLWKLLQKWDFNTNAPIQPIYKALFEALKSERINNTPEERKCENEPENSVICDVVAGRTNSEFLCVEKRRLKSIGNSLYKDDDNLYFWYDTFCYCLGGYTRGVATFLKNQGNKIRTKIREMIEQGGISTGSAKILYEKMRKDDTTKKSESMEETHEDYPPEPYNEADEKVIERPCKELNGKASDHKRPICDHAEKSANSCGNSCHVLPRYLRQKAFSYELFNVRRKISRFKRRYLLRLKVSAFAKKSP